MTHKVAFFVRHFTERGTENAIFNYAFYNESLLGNKSIIIYYNENPEDYVNTSREKFEKNFPTIELKNINLLSKIIKKENISHAYIRSHGFYKDFYKFKNKKIWGTCQTIITTFLGQCQDKDQLLDVLSEKI